MMKKIMSLLLAALLLGVTMGSALAGQGDQLILSQANADGYYSGSINNVFVVGSKLYIMLDGMSISLKEYDLETGAMKDYDMQALSDRMRGLTDEEDAAEESAEETEQTSGRWQESIDAWFVWQGEIYALVNRYLYQESGNQVDGGHVRKVILNADDTVDLAAEDAVRLDWTDMVQTAGSWINSRYLSYTTAQGDKLYASSWDDDGSQALIIFDLTTGQMTEQAIQDMNEFTVLPDGRILVNQYIWGDEAVELFRFYDPETESMEDLARFPFEDGQISMFAYDPEKDTIYFVREGEIYAAPGRDIGSAQPVNDSPATGRIFAPVLPDGRLLVWNYSAVFLRNTDPSLRSQITLRIRPFAWSQGMESATFDFMNAHSDIGIIREEWGDESTLLQSMMNRDNSVDIYLISVDSNAYNAVYDRGFMADLSGDAKLMEMVTGMYPFASENMMRDGKLVAVPVYANGSTIGYNPQTLEKLGMTAEELPKTWDEYFNFLQELPGRLAGSECRPFEIYTYRNDLQRTMLMQILNQFTIGHADEKMDNDLLRGLLDRIQQMDYEALGVMTDEEIEQMEEEGRYSELGGEKESLLTTWADPLMGNAYNVPLCLALSSGEEPVTAVGMSVAYINPYSGHQEEAKLFLQSLVEHLDTTTRYSLYPDLNEPVRYPNHEETKAYLEKWLKQARKNAEEAEEEEIRENWEQIAADYQKSLDEYEEKNWMISPQTISEYRSRAQYVHAIRWNYYSALSANDSSDQFSDLQNGFVQGTTTARELLSFIDKKVQMMRLEGN